MPHACLFLRNVIESLFLCQWFFFHILFQSEKKEERIKGERKKLRQPKNWLVSFSSLTKQKPFSALNQDQLITIFTKKITVQTLQDFLLSKNEPLLNFPKLLRFGWTCSSVKNGMPLDLAIGSTSFLGQNFLVARGVFLPRVETEELAQKIINRHAKDKKKLKILELGCGSGVIAVSLLRNLNATVKAIDISNKAIKQTALNAQKLLSKQKIKQLNLLKGDVFSKKFSHQMKGETFDIIVTNPPYIAKTEKKIVDEQTKKYDPPKALYAGEDGLQFYEKIFPLLPFLLEKNSVFYGEIGFSQADKVTSLAKFSLPKYLPNLLNPPDYQMKNTSVKIGLKWNIFVSNDIFGKARFLTVELKKTASKLKKTAPS